MVYRYSWLAGIAGIGLAFWELSDLLRPSSTGTNWQTAIVVSVLLSMGITWTSLAYRARVWMAALANTAAFAIVVGILVAPETLWGIFPTADTFSVIASEFTRAAEIIQHGVEPVRPVPGLVMLLAGLFWTLGFLLVAGLLNGRPFVATVTPLVVALQFVIIDRRPKNLVHIGIFVGICALTLLAIRTDERDHGTGRLSRTNATRRPQTRPSVGIILLVAVTILASVGAVVAVGDRVPDSGMVAWRTPAGYSDEYSGSGTYNLYTDIRANLINQSDNPLFTATISGEIDPASVRFRMVTLDQFSNGRWSTSRIQAFPIDEDPWISEAQAYRGPTTPITAEIRIENLSMPWLPTPVTANGAYTDDRSDYQALRTRRLDGSLYLPGDFTRRGQEYAVTADVAIFDATDYARLARTDDGRLSPLFAAAEEDGHIIGPSDNGASRADLPDTAYWTSYPSDVGGAVVAQARALTDKLDTNFEKALALENWFREDGDFTYNTSVPSNFTTDSIEDWLFDESNDYVRNGYCEQFALTMALMARAVDVPSRVVIGFTPGKPINDDTVLVMDRNAHSWVEIWIPSHGWMSFDPTPRADFTLPTANEQIEDALGFSAVDYAALIPEGTEIPADAASEGPTNPGLDARPEVEEVDVFNPTGATVGGGGMLPSWVRVLGMVGALLAVLAVVPPIVKWVRRRRRSRRLASGDITAAWIDITERLADLGDPVDVAATPLESAAAVDDDLVPLAEHYGDTVYGEKQTTALMIDETRAAHRTAGRHLVERYSRGRRIVALYRPTRLRERLTRLLRRRP